MGYGGGNLTAAESAIKVCPARIADYKRRVTSRSVFEVLVCCAPTIDAAEVALGLLERERGRGGEAERGGGAGKGGQGVSVGAVVVGKVHPFRGAGGAGGVGGASLVDVKLLLWAVCI